MGGPSPELTGALIGGLTVVLAGVSTVVIAPTPATEAKAAFPVPTFNTAGYGWFEVGDDFLPPLSSTTSPPFGFDLMPIPKPDRPDF